MDVVFRFAVPADDQEFGQARADLVHLTGPAARHIEGNEFRAERGLDDPYAHGR